MNGLKIKIEIAVKRMMQLDLNGVLISAVLSAGILFVYSFAASVLLPASINSVFTSVLWKIFAGFTGAAVFLFCIWRLSFGKSALRVEKKIEPLKPLDFILLLIPMTPVFQYVLSNQESLTFLNSLLMIGMFALICLLFGAVIPFFLSVFASKKAVSALSLALLSVLLAMAYLSARMGWNRTGLIGIQLAVLAGAMIAVGLLRLIPAKIAAVAVTAFFAANTASGFLAMRKNTDGVHDSGEKSVRNAAVSALISGSIKTKNDVFFIVFESYASNETLRHYGYDNSAQNDFLKENGFRVYDDVYSIGAPTEQSVSKVFNIDTVSQNKKYLAGSGFVQDILRAKGYRIHGVFDNNWNLRGLPIGQIKYDYCFPAPSGAMDFGILVRAVLMGEFTDTVSFEGVSYNSYVERKHRVISRAFGVPSFMYSHSGFPGHSPSGDGMSLEEAPAVLSSYLKKISAANEEMKNDVLEIIKSNPEAIVVFAGDHGPFMTKTGYGMSKGRGNYTRSDVDRFDVQDRFGMFLAVRWPDMNRAGNYDIRTLQDIMPAVLSYLFDDSSVFNALRVGRRIADAHRIMGVNVEDGVVRGGKDDGKKLYDDNK